MGIRRLSLIAILFAVASPVFAVPVTWTLTGVTFSDGGTAAGSFVYDADTNTFSSINISVTGGSLPAVTYVTTHPLAVANFPSFLPTASGNLTGVRVIVLSVGSALTNAAGTIALVATLAEGPCDNATCSSASGVRSFAAGGSLVGTAAPTAIPAISTAVLTLAAVLLGAAGLRMMRRPGAEETLAG